MNISDILKLINKNNILLGLSVLIKFSSIFISILIVRWLNTNFEPRLLDQYNTAVLSYLAIILSVVNLGIPEFLHKEFTKIDDKEYLNNLWTTINILRFATYIVGLIVIVVTYRISKVENLFMILGIYSSQFILLADQNFRSVTDANDKSIRFSLTDLTGKVILTFLLYLSVFLNFKVDILNYFIFVSIGAYLTTYILDFYINRNIVSWSKFDWSVISKNKKALFFLAVSGLISTSSWDIIFLQYNHTNSYLINGYSNALKLFTTAMVLPGIIVPVLSSRYKRKKDLLKNNDRNLLKRYLIYLLTISSLFSIFLFLSSTLIFKVIDPKNLYSDVSIDAFHIFNLSLCFSFISMFLRYVNVFENNEKFEIYNQLSNAIIFLILFALLIPIYGITGAAISYLIIAIFDIIKRYSIKSLHKDL